MHHTNDRSKIIKLLINGSAQFKGKIIQITRNRFPSFNTFLDQLTFYFKTALPNGVRRIYRFGSFREIHILDDLENYGIYICCSNERLRKVSYDTSFVDKPLANLLEKRIGHRYSLHNQIREVSPIQDSKVNAEVEEMVNKNPKKLKSQIFPKLIKIVYNDKPKEIIKIFVNRNLNITLQECLRLISINVKRKVYKHDIIKVFTASGREITSLTEFYQNRSPLLAFTNPVVMYPLEVKEMIKNLFPNRQRAERYFSKWLLEEESEHDSRSMRLHSSASSTSQSNHSKERLEKSENDDLALSNREKLLLGRNNYRRPTEMENSENDKNKTNINHQSKRDQRKKEGKHKAKSPESDNESMEKKYKEILIQTSPMFFLSDKMIQVNFQKNHFNKITKTSDPINHYQQGTQVIPNIKHFEKFTNVLPTIRHFEKGTQSANPINYLHQITQVTSLGKHYEKMTDILPTIKHHEKITEVYSQLSSSFFGEKSFTRNITNQDTKTNQSSPRYKSSIEVGCNTNISGGLFVEEDKPFFISKEYKLVRLLSESSKAKVYLSTHINKDFVVIKKISISNDKWNREKESKLISSLNHENIIKCLEVFKRNSVVEIVMEYMILGNFDRYINEQTIYEENIIHFVKCLAHGLSYLHSKFIIHRQIIPTNILYQMDPLLFKICDMSYAVDQSKENVLMAEELPMTIYCAPEINTNNKYNEKVDIWSLAVIVNNIVCNIYQEGKTEIEFKYEENHSNWTNWSPECHFLIKQMLKENPSHRIDASAILNHSWITQYQIKDGNDGNLMPENNPYQRYYENSPGNFY